MTASETSEKKAGIDAHERPLSPRLIWRIFSTLGPHIWSVLAGMVMVCLCVAADLQMISVVGDIINEGKILQTSPLVLVTPLIVLCFANRIFGFAQWLVTIYATNRAMCNLRILFFSKLQALSKHFYDQHKSGWLVARSTGDMSIINDFMSYTLMILGVCATAVGFSVIKIAEISPILLLPGIITVPLVFSLTLWYKRRMAKTQRTAREQNSRLVANMTETVRGIRVVQAFSREKQNLEDFNDLNRASHDTEIKAARLDAIFIPSMSFISLLNITIVVTFASWFVNSPHSALLETRLAPGDIVAYILFMNMIVWPTRMMVEVYSMSIKTMAAAERVYEIIDMKPDIEGSPEAKDITQLDGKIEFRDVSFRYDKDGDWVLKNIQIDIKPGEAVALVGETGAGKTTISSLAARFYDVDTGEVMIDGMNIKDITLSSLHRRIGIVLQQGFLFSGTIMDNLRFCQPDITEEKAVRTAKSIGTHEAISRLPDGYHTRVLEGGSSISEGQRQIVSITRALLADPRILILDEPTSSLDIYTESVIQEALDKVTKNRTTIVIAHRLSTVMNADRIIVLDKGRILEEGTHEELIKTNGKFSELVRNSEERGFLDSESTL